MHPLVVLVLFLAASGLCGERMTLVHPMQFSGMANASAAVAINSRLFVAADDEENKLRLYECNRPGPPLKEYDVSGFLEVTGNFPEADLEGGARIGDRAFWIGSHGRNRNAKERFNRCRFFATDIRITGGEVMLAPVGRPYKSLLDDLLADSRLAKFNLAAASLFAPKAEEGLNIEGLSATPEDHLLLGFRNPIPDGRALLVPLLNPNDVIADQGQRARLGNPIQLDLGGLGIRDMALCNGTYIIIAGSKGAGGDFQIYSWAGGGASPERIKVKHLNRYNPEALILYPDRGLRELQVLCDDGTRAVEGVPGKAVTDSRLKSFRSFWLVNPAVIGEE
jgi:hypothetical protein